jgi:protein SCO1
MPGCRPRLTGGIFKLIACLAIFFAVAGNAAAVGKDVKDPFDRREALAISQAAIGTTVADHTFTDRAGATVSLRDFRGKPIVISLIFTSCYHTCPAITQGLKRAVGVARAALGRDRFTVLTIGFDTAADTPERMRLYAQEQGIDVDGWRSLSTDGTTIEALARDLGFIYFASPRGFDHLAQITIVDADGRVYRQIYGQDFEPPAVVEPLRELALGVTYNRSGVSNLLERVRLFCTVYDPASGRYRFDNSIIVAAVSGILSLGAVAIFLIRQLRRSGGAANRGSLPPIG